MAPYFPTTYDLYRVLQRELPPGAYLDGAATAGYSTADMYAVASIISARYDNLQIVYNNEFAQSAVEYLDEWETTYFGSPINAASGTAQRQQALLAKIRAMPSITLWAVLTTVVSYLPIGVYAQVVPVGCGSGPTSGAGWVLNVSRLGSTTILGWGNYGTTAQLNNPNGLDYCALINGGTGTGWRLNQSQLGINTVLTGLNTYQTISAIQAKAYTYLIRIFDYQLTGAALQAMLLAVTAAEPARSTHILQQNQSLAQFALIVPVPNVTQASGVNTITQDPTQPSGYSGLVTPF